MNASAQGSQIKFVLIAGFVGVLLMVLFPPYRSVFTRADTGSAIRENSIGFHFLLDPPTSTGRELVSVNFGQLGLQVAGLGCLVGVACLIVPSQAKKDEPKLGFGGAGTNVAGDHPSAKTERVEKPREVAAPIGKPQPSPVSSSGNSRSHVQEVGGHSMVKVVSTPALPGHGNNPPHSGDEIESVVLFLISGIVTVVCMVARFQGGTTASVIGGIIGCLLIGGVVAVLIWAFNAGVRGRKDFIPAARVGWGFFMPIWAALSVVVHLENAPTIRRQVEQDSAAKSWERIRDQLSTQKQSDVLIRPERGGALPTEPLKQVPLKNWHVAVITIDLPAQPRNEAVSDASKFKMSSNFIAETPDKELHVHVAFRRLHSSYPTPEGVWRERLAKLAAGGMDLERTTEATTVNGHKALRWGGNLGAEEARTLVVAAGHDYCIVSVTGAPQAIAAHAERILKSVQVVGFDG